MDESLPRWFDDENFPPLAIYYGGRDYLVATEPLLERIHEREECVKLLRVEKVPTYEVCNFSVYSGMRVDVNKTVPFDGICVGSIVISTLLVS